MYVQEQAGVVLCKFCDRWFSDRGGLTVNRYRGWPMERATVNPQTLVVCGECRRAVEHKRDLHIAFVDMCNR